MKIAVGTLARDSEKNIPKYKKFLDSLKSEIEFHSFVYENDSTDNTKAYLHEVADYWVTEDLGLTKFEGSPATEERSKLMCGFRNKLKDLIFNTNGGYDIIIFTDIDLMSWPNPTTISTNIDLLIEKDIGAITSNGQSFYQNSIIYYDIWSLVIEKKIQNHKVWTNTDIINYNTDTIISVDSAFGGLGIYNAKYIKNIKYIPLYLDGFPCPWHPVTRIACEHCSLNLQIKNLNKEILIDKNQIVFR